MCAHDFLEEGHRVELDLWLCKRCDWAEHMTGSDDFQQERKALELGRRDGERK